MTKLSVNINKVATIRNARGGNNPDLIKVAMDCERFGAEGITVHPRPDERHIRYSDVRNLKPILTTEFNIEGNPNDDFIRLVEEIKPAQITLVPDAHDVITSNSGWDTKKNLNYLKGVVSIFKSHGIRTSIFVDPVPEMIFYAAEIRCDRVELYTESYASGYSYNRERALEPYYRTAIAVKESGLGLNAGHDLNLENLNYFARNITWLDEVSIGHALVCDAIYLGLENTIQAYLRQLNNY